MPSPTLKELHGSLIEEVEEHKIKAILQLKTHIEKIMFDFHENTGCNIVKIEVDILAHYCQWKVDSSFLSNINIESDID